MTSQDPHEPLGDTSSYPVQPGHERPYGTPLPGYEQPPRQPEEPPRRGGSGRSWMVAFFLLLAGVVAAAVIWFVVVDSEDTGELDVSPAIVDFGDVDLGKRSAVQNVLLDNQSPDVVRISSITIEGKDARDFQVSDETTCSPERPLEAGAQCTVGVRFRPRAREGRSAVLVLRLVGEQAPLRVDLRGNGVGEATVVLDASQLDMGSVLIGKSSTRRVTLTNAGNAPLQIQEIFIDGDDAGAFRVGKATDCPTDERVAAGATCTIAVRFTPKQGGKRTATLTIVHDAAGSPSGVRLRGEGRGQAELVVEPGSLDFGGLEVGQQSDVQSVTITNTGTASFVLTRIEIAGPAISDFTFADTGTCVEGLELEPAGSCSVDIAFSPTAGGELSAALEVETRGGLASRVDLAGTGTEPPGATTGTTETNP